MFKVADSDGDLYTYFMTGEIKDNRYIEGDWFDQDDGNTYHGTFLLSVDVNMNKLIGYWVGTACIFR